MYKFYFFLNINLFYRLLLGDTLRPLGEAFLLGEVDRLLGEVDFLLGEIDLPRLAFLRGDILLVVGDLDLFLTVSFPVVARGLFLSLSGPTSN